MLSKYKFREGWVKCFQVLKLWAHTNWATHDEETEKANISDFCITVLHWLSACLIRMTFVLSYDSNPVHCGFCNTRCS